MKLTWTQELSIGVEAIDDQHKELFERINLLRTALSEGKGSHAIAETSKFLADYVLEHFSAEEHYMSRYDYPDYQHHKSEHTAFMRNLVAFKNNLDRLESEGGMTSFLAIDMQRQLHDWLIHHIGKADKAFGSFLMAKQ